MVATPLGPPEHVGRPQEVGRPELEDAISADVVVIGAGFAGLSAAVRLAGAGLKVVVLEEAPRLGGRATSFTDKTTGDHIDNGQHALFGCYRETYAFLRAIGTDALAPLDPKLSLVMADTTGRRAALSCPPLPAPMHLMAGVLAWSALPLADRWSTAKMAPFLRQARKRGAAAAAAEVPEHLTVAAWLSSMGQGPVVREWLWHPLALAALNQSPEVAGARAFARVLGELFSAEADASALGVPTVPLDALYAEPAARFVKARGGRVLRRTPARLSAEKTSGGFWVATTLKKPPDVFSAPAVICAVPWHALGALWPDRPPEGMAPIISQVNELASEPIVSVNLWFDRPFLTDRQVGLVGTHFHWAFGNDVGCLFRQETGGKDTRRHFRVAMVASGARDLLRQDNDALVALAERELGQCVPGARSARRTHALVVRAPRATFSVAPGAPARPGTVTPVPGLFLAGDWTDTGLPGTIEGAVRSGHAAAAAVLRGR